jgi:hypothetical protein
MPYGTVNTDILQGTLGGIISPDSSVFRNRIINGAMVINQRGFSGSNSNNTYTLDRWVMGTDLDGKFTLSQSSTAPAGFNNSLLVTSSSAYSVPSGGFYRVSQYIEGYNIADLGWGTANAKTVTLSFWVRSSLTGTFGGALYNSGGSRSYPFTYTISSADTWEQKSIKIPGDTSGTWLTTNGFGVAVNFSMGMGSNYLGPAGSWASALYVSATGSTNIVSTNGATWYVTGVQLEAGSTASSFEYRNYGQELALCQRYYYLAASAPSYIAAGGYFTAGFVIGILNFPTTMRATPTLSATSGTNYYTVYRQGVGDPFDSLAINSAGVNASGIENTSTVSGTAGDVGFLYVDNTAVRVAFQAEL